MSRSRHRSNLAVFLVPGMIATTTLVGLTVALFGDGWRDRLSWVALGIPVATALHFGLRRGRRET